jgi:hypothetical protein
VIGGLLASVYALKKILNPTNQRVVHQELSYEMPRARDEVLPYSLNGRRVVRISPPSAASPISNAKAPITTGNSVAAKGNVPAAKKTDAKKAAAKTAQQKKKPVVTVTVIGANQSHLKPFDNSGNSGDDNQAPMSGFTPPPAGKTNPVSVQQDDDKVKMSTAQWRSVLFNQPTAKNGASFLAAFQGGDVDEPSYYQISEELFVDSAADRQKLGFELLKSTPSVKSYTILLSHYQEKTPEPMRTQISTTLKSYGEASHFAILTKLLYSTDAHVVQSAQSLLATAIVSHNQHQPTNGNNGQSSNNNGRDVRSPGSAVNATAAQFNAFVPALRRLVTSNDPAVAQQAQSLLESILAMRAA